MATFQRKATTSPHDGLTNAMMVLEEGKTSSIARPSSAGNKIKSITKASPGELIVLSADIESSGRQTPTDSPCNEGRARSAGRIEKRLELTRKNDNDYVGAEVKPPTVLPLNRHPNQQPITWNSSTKISHEPIKHEARAPQAEKKIDLNALSEGAGQSGQIAQETDSSDEDSSDDDDDDDDDDEDDNDPPQTPSSGATTQSDTPKAPIELMGQFLNLVMSEEYQQAQELCHQILLLEPDNSTCHEFLPVIAEKIKQDEEEEDESDDDEDDDDDEGSSDDEDEDSDDDDDGDDDDDSGRESDEDEDESSDSDVELPPGPINLLMGGLPVIPQAPNKPE